MRYAFMSPHSVLTVPPLSVQTFISGTHSRTASYCNTPSLAVDCLGSVSCVDFRLR